MRLRILTGLPLAAVAIILVIIGDAPFVAAIILIFGIAVVEFVQLVARKGHRAFGGLALVWMLVIMLDRAFPRLNLLEPGISFLLIATLGWALIRYRQGTQNAATGFAMTVAGGMYVGWAGAQFINLRAHTDGLFWTLTLLVAVWSSDTIAYVVGKAFGHIPLMLDVSPRKTREGYLSAVVGATILTAASALLWRQLGASASVTPFHGLLIGLLVSIVAPLGDLGISMFKRYAGAKDSSQLLPGHGGLLDRIDALMIGALLAYHYVLFFVP
jgi:phosphatidate cytidylyltransferase